ncbi:hypothetical protein [Candidatus Albibeggiatoa sp. nov. NOAA]|uniref:hypothetical protein n=1 Tax=Candidatus Albibeggiatoa sp. nov. NOAA TaxID=3162724 RepID=UPI003305541E|nr:hypothetical protein [Thiotrichaceae bacterium]
MLLDLKTDKKPSLQSDLAEAAESKLEIAKTMLLEGMSISLTAKITQLPIEQVEQLKHCLVH